MPLWDSVQRGLEKASQEAARIAKTQKLRSTIDNLARQIHTQNSNLINKATELFETGKLTQSELLPICQELAYLKVQINDAQNELRQIQLNQPASNQPVPAGQVDPATYPPTVLAGPVPYMPPSGGQELAETLYAPPPPDYQSYFDTVGELAAPPPPPGIEHPTISAMETVMMSAGPAEKRLCPACQAEVQPGHAFCHNCGTLVQSSEALHSPTIRANTAENTYAGGEETVRADKPEATYSGGDETIRTDAPLPDS